MNTTLNLVAVVVLVILNGFFVAAEFALVSARATRNVRQVFHRAIRLTTDQESVDDEVVVPVIAVEEQLGFVMVHLELIIAVPAVDGQQS